ncbi:hypothetical protein RB598_003213 [Gaeumannomyces tritici]
MLIREVKRFLVLFVPLITAVFLTVRLIKKHTQPRPTWANYSPRARGAALPPRWSRQRDQQQRPLGGDAVAILKDNAGSGSGSGIGIPAAKDALAAAVPKEKALPPPKPPPGSPAAQFKLGETAPVQSGVEGFAPFDDPFQGAPDSAPHTHIVLSSAGTVALDAQGKTGAAVTSQSGRGGSYFPIQFGDRTAINPNVMAHPLLADTYIIVAQEHPQRDGVGSPFAEITCNAAFQRGGVLACVTFPVDLAIAHTATTEGACEASVKYGPLSMNRGPHDARVFYGPDGAPLVVFGSNSGLTCFGQWIQDLRVPARWDDAPVDADALNAALEAGDHPSFAVGGGTRGAVGDAARSAKALSAPGIVAAAEKHQFALATEMHRPKAPPPSLSSPATQNQYEIVEKNWFVFWDRHGERYVHHDMHPRRVFAALARDGTAGPDLGPATADADAACFKRFFPDLRSRRGASLPTGDSESIVEDDEVHQATNSLTITLCRRADQSCAASEANTFVMSIVHRKRSHAGGLRYSYEPYVVLFRQAPPFALHGISAKPLWIKGRRRMMSPAALPAEEMEEGGHVRSEMFYITSIGWRGAKQRYHGYLDDVLFVGFGIEDKRPAAIDVTAADLLQGLGLCVEAGATA